MNPFKLFGNVLSFGALGKLAPNKMAARILDASTYRLLMMSVIVVVLLIVMVLVADTVLWSWTLAQWKKNKSLPSGLV